MGDWIEIPACRVYRIAMEEILTGFGALNENGAPTKAGEKAYRMVRLSDGKVFKPARFTPAEWYSSDYFYLEEI